MDPSHSDSGQKPVSAPAEGRVSTGSLNTEPSTSTSMPSEAQGTSTARQAGKGRRRKRKPSSSYSDSSESSAYEESGSHSRRLAKKRLDTGRFSKKKKRKTLRQDCKRPQPPPPVQQVTLQDGFNLVVPDINNPTRWQLLDFYDSVEDCDEQTLSRFYVEEKYRRVEDRFLKIFLSCTYKPPVEADGGVDGQSASTGYKKCPQRLCLIVDRSSDRCRLFESRTAHNHPTVECTLAERKRRIVMERKKRKQRQTSRESSASSSLDSDSELSASADEKEVRVRSQPSFTLRNYFTDLEEIAKEAGIDFNSLNDTCMFFTAKPHVEGEKPWFNESVEEALRWGNQLRLSDYGRTVGVAEYQRGVFQPPKHYSHGRWYKGDEWSGFAARVKNKLSQLFGS